MSFKITIKKFASQEDTVQNWGLVKLILKEIFPTKILYFCFQIQA